MPEESMEDIKARKLPMTQILLEINFLALLNLLRHAAILHIMQELLT